MNGSSMNDIMLTEKKTHTLNGSNTNGGSNTNEIPIGSKIHTLNGSGMNGSGDANEKKRLTNGDAASEDSTSYTSSQLFCKILLLSSLGFANDLGYAVIAAYATPLLVAAGLKFKWASISLILSPILAFLTQGHIGYCSDQCQCSWGRRRPFILFLTVLTCIGFGATPFVPLLADRVSESVAIAGTIIGVLIMTYSQGILQLPIRAYLLDSLPIGHVQLGNFVFTLFIGVGCFLGSVLSAIDWSNLTGRDVTIVNQAQVICLIVVAATILCTITGLCSFKETPYKPSPVEKTDIGHHPRKVKFVSEFVEINNEVFRFVWHLSKEMWLLWFVTFLGFCSEFCFGYFFTTFVGEAVYKGDPNAMEDTEAYQAYAKGVRMGSWGLALEGALMSIVSLFQDKLANLIGLKRLFIIVQVSFVVVTMGLTAHTFYNDNVVAVIILGGLSGPYMGVLLSIPFTLVAMYEEAGLLLRKPIAGMESVHGRACFVITTSFFMGEIVAAILIGTASDLLHTTTTVVAIATVLSAIGVAFSLLINVPSDEK